MSERRFNPSNKPGTCVWCGRTLHMEYRTEWQTIDRKLKRCPRCKSRWLLQPNGPGSTYYCDDCNTTWRGWARKVISRTPRHDNVGLNGDGMFDTTLCQAEFGLYAAKTGFRFKAPSKGKLANA